MPWPMLSRNSDRGLRLTLRRLPYVGRSSDAMALRWASHPMTDLCLLPGWRMKARPGFRHRRWWQMMALMSTSWTSPVRFAPMRSAPMILRRDASMARRCASSWSIGRRPMPDSSCSPAARSAMSKPAAAPMPALSPACAVPPLHCRPPLSKPVRRNAGRNWEIGAAVSTCVGARGARR